MNRLATHLLFIVVLVAGGFLAGLSNRPDAWFAALVKPPFQPPAFLFAPVWTILYVLIAIAGARTFLAAPRSRRMALWAAQLVLNFLWSPAFFGLHDAGLGLAIVAALLLVDIAFVAASWRVDRVSAGLFVPYVAWTAFATVLNASIVVLN
jgi:tryptophan-rich sensory protein